MEVLSPWLISMSDPNENPWKISWFYTTWGWMKYVEIQPQEWLQSHSHYVLCVLFLVKTSMLYCFVDVCRYRSMFCIMYMRNGAKVFLKCVCIYIYIYIICKYNQYTSKHIIHTYNLSIHRDLRVKYHSF